MQSNEKTICSKYFDQYLHFINRKADKRDNYLEQSLSLPSYPIGKNGFAQGCQHTLGMKLQTTHVILLVAQSHDLSVTT